MGRMQKRTVEEAAAAVRAVMGEIGDGEDSEGDGDVEGVEAKGKGLPAKAKGKAKATAKVTVAKAEAKTKAVKVPSVSPVKKRNRCEGRRLENIFPDLR